MHMCSHSVDFFWFQQYASKTTVPAQHVIEKETETSFTLNQYTCLTQPSTAITASLGQWYSILFLSESVDSTETENQGFILNCSMSKALDSWLLDCMNYADCIPEEGN